MRKKKNIGIYAFIILFGFFMLYPILWLTASAFKKNSEIFTDVGLKPTVFNFDAFIQGFKGIGNATFGVFFLNSFKIVIPVVLFTLISGMLVAYGFARFKFPGKKIWFSLMIATLMMPASVLTIPTYVMFTKFGWVNTYLPFIVPAAFSTSAFFVYMLVQFLRGIPKEIDEAAKIDGCNSLQILVLILTPLCKPALFSAAIFRFLWTWNDFFGNLVYINSVSKYPISLGLRMAIDNTAGSVNWNSIMAMSVISILPPIILFFLAQDYFVEGVASSGLKG
jgi:oligogalacturonide transport system permease protein